MLDSSESTSIFSSPEAINEAERTLSPQIDRVPLQDAINAMPLEGANRRQVSPKAPAFQSDWQRRAFASFAVVALACVAVAALAALLSIGRHP